MRTQPDIKIKYQGVKLKKKIDSINDLRSNTLQLKY
jgi:hypothetical protein